MKTNPAIEIKSTTKTFGAGKGEVRALDDVTVTIRENEFFTLLGPSGCGKTTLLRLIAGFDHPTSGTIFLRGQDISYLPLYRRSVNTVFQSYALFPHMTVAQNIAFGLKMLDKPKAHVAETVSAMLKLVRMEALRDRRTDQISGGQQQRVALARALAPQPKVLLLDEPLSALDYKLRKDMQLELKRLQHQTGIIFVFVTHDQEEALTMSDRVAVMNEGKILQIGSPRDIYDYPTKRFVADFIGETNYLDATVVSSGARRAILRVMGAHEVAVDLPEGIKINGKVTAVTRPEYAHLSSEGGDLQGVLENVVYFGTDTHYHVCLEDNSKFVVRRQNLRDSAEDFQVKQTVYISLSASAIQILGD